MSRRLTTTLKAWPVIAVATMGLCFLTKQGAAWVGIDMPDQHQVEIMRDALLRAFASSRAFATCLFLLLQVLVVLPALEEIVFRWLLFRWPSRRIPNRYRPRVPLALFASALFSAAHYITQPFPDAAFIALLFFGFAQCWLYLRTDRLWCPMLNHALFNLTNTVLILAAPA